MAFFGFRVTSGCHEPFSSILHTAQRKFMIFGLAAVTVRKTSFALVCCLAYAAVLEYAAAKLN